MKYTQTLILISMACATLLPAQQVVAPTPEQVGSARGQSIGDYNITNSFELGYRFDTVAGNDGLYRSDINYGSGLRLLGSNLTVDSKDGHGRFFDEILLNTIGLGRDPYESVVLRIRKNRLYRYDMTWRENQYYNPGVVISAGDHLMNTTRLLQDHDLTFLPDNKRVQFDVGYSRNTIVGPALSSAQEFDTNSIAFPVFSNVRQQYNDYRVGGILHLGGFTINVRRTWEFYKQDTLDHFNGSEPSTEPGDPTVLQTFARNQPFHGSNGAWLGTLFTRRKYWAVNARFNYASGKGDFALNEMATGIDRFSAATNREIQVFGDAQRPTLGGDFNVSLFPTEKFSIVNHTAVSNIRIDGNSSYQEFDLSTLSSNFVEFNFLGVRTVSNTTDFRYNFNKWIGAYAGYTFSDRQIRLEEAFVLPGVPGGTGSNLYPQEATLSSEAGGLHLQPIKGWITNLEGEVGHASGALTPVSDRNYHTLGGRTEYRTKKLQLQATYRTLYNENAPLSFTTYSSRSRQASASASWAVTRWLSFDTSYTKLHLDSVGGLQFFAGVGTPTLQQGFDSIYVSNIHAANAGARIEIGKRADLFVGYTITKDTGDGRSTASTPGSTGVPALLQSVQTFPLTYESPMARVSFKITPKLRWNAAWQYYGYNEQFQLFSYYENYHAHTGFTSLLWSF
ncbi:MAG: hypothetical protein WDO73_00080 [Ignavibacteriota bacterium]